MEKNNSNQLRSLFWEATLRCNAYCDFCGSRCGDYSAWQLREEEINKGTICKCFEEIAKEYDPKSIMLNITGGEPLIREDLFEIMTFASNLGFPWGMVSNGTLIDDAVIENMKKSGMKTISISLDGTSIIHNELRRLVDGFEKIKNAVALLKKADFLDELQITTVVNHRNINELEPLFNILLEWGIDTWRLATVDPIGRAENQKELLLTEEDYRQYFLFFKTHQFNGKIVLMTSCSHYLGGYDNLYRSHRFSCESGKHIASILANGDIYVCPNVKRIENLIQGNINKDSFTEVWNNGFKWFRNPDRLTGSRCSACEYYEFCRGDSLHTWDFSCMEPRVCYKDHSFDDSFFASNEQMVKDELLTFYPKMKGICISYNNSSNVRLIFTPFASKQFLTYFEWGEKSPRNCFELIAGLVGFSKDNLFVVEHIIPGNLEDRGETTASFSYNNYKDLLKEVAILNRGLSLSHEKYKLSESFSLLGIAHTHPLDLLPILSLPDIELHGDLQKENKDIISLIINPQKRLMAAYHNSVFTPIDMELLVKDELELNEF